MTGCAGGSSASSLPGCPAARSASARAGGCSALARIRDSHAVLVEAGVRELTRVGRDGTDGARGAGGDRGQQQADRLRSLGAGGQLRQPVHRGAEKSLLRDLYRWQGGAVPRRI
ncbi:hypothetical protein ACIPX0_41335 [Streptomyces sp. NPDC090075]|uniref:hypothetical protein n=1 Tax=Streptomyces sp. NPDC090075 TaxID=3365937 RepID=UPI0037F452EF